MPNGEQVRKAQQAMSRKTTFSNNWKKAKARVQKVQARIANVRRNVRAKSGLYRAILDQGWHEFRRQLDYKLAWRGTHLVVVPPLNTSRTCPECGFEANADQVAAINLLRAWRTSIG